MFEWARAIILSITAGRKNLAAEDAFASCFISSNFPL